MKFNQKVLVPPVCGKSIAGLCTFEEFKLAIKDVEITNSDWKKVCDESKGI